MLESEARAVVNKELKTARATRVKAMAEEVRAKRAVHIFTDGACRGNPGPGGWGCVIKTKGNTLELSGSDPDTTNNRMEMTACIEALRSLKRRAEVILTTDSKYVMNGLTKWLPKWKQNKWVTSSKEPVKNMDLWIDLDKLCQRHKVQWVWVKGHAGHPENERCDQLATAAI